MRSQGTLICFEGLDGAGKTTVSHRVADELSRAGTPSLLVEKKDTHFSRESLSQRMSLLRHIIWEYGDTPIQELGDEHSLYIMASWFSALDRGKIRPLLEQGHTVIVDNWFYKFIARFKLKPDLDFDHVQRCFAHLSRPDCVILLDVDPATAAARKEGYSLAETGNLDGLHGRTAENFVQYQQSVRGVLMELAAKEGWLKLDVQGRSREEVTREVLRVLAERLSQPV